MSTEVIAIDSEPSEWTAEHDKIVRALRSVGIERRAPQPGAFAVTTVITDVDGDPLAIGTSRLATLESPSLRRHG